MDCRADDTCHAEAGLVLPASGSAQEVRMDKPVVARKHQITLEFGGLRLEVYFTRNFGASVVVFATTRPAAEMLRFDDFVDVPHYHAPGDDPHPNNLDVAEVGEPREFFLNYLVENLPTVLPQIGFG